MEWIIIILAVIAHFMIGGFISGVFKLDLDFLMLMLWPLFLVTLVFIWISDIGEDLGYKVRDAFKKGRNAK